MFCNAIFYHGLLAMFLVSHPVSRCFYSCTVLFLCFVFLLICMNWASFHLPENRYRIDSTIKSLQKNTFELAVRECAYPVLSHFHFTFQSLCHRAPSAILKAKGLIFQVLLQTRLRASASWQHCLTSLLPKGFG